MMNNKKKRYPTDRIKLHALLDSLLEKQRELNDEVEYVMKLTQKADNNAILSTVDSFNITPEGLAELLGRLKSGELPGFIPNAVPQYARATDEETDSEPVTDSEMTDEEDESDDDEA